MVPRVVFDQVGLFDERFFMYFEDTDLCRRVWQAGYKVVYLGETEVIHMHMRMSRGGVVKIFSNKLTREHIKSWVKYTLKHRSGKSRSLMSNDKAQMTNQ
jgi:GT2 family glycosyltransferase